MPALPDVPQVVRVAISGVTTGGGVWLSRFYLHYTGTAPTGAQLNTFCSSVGANMGTDLRSLISSDISYTLFVAQDLSSSTAAQGEVSTSTAGTRAGGALPAGVCTVCSYEISRRYRGGHPRGYWPFGTDTDVSNNQQWTSAFVAAVNTGMAAFMAANLAAGWTSAGTLTQVNVSYYSGNSVIIDPVTGRARNKPVVRVTPLVDTVSSIVTRQSFGSQRRRSAFVD